MIGLVWVFMISYLGCMVESTTIFPGGHFKKLKPIAVYESSMPLIYIVPNPMNRLPDKVSIPQPPCPFTDPELRRLAAAVEELDRNVDHFQLHHGPYAATTENTDNTQRRQRAIEVVGDFLNFCFGTATESQLHTLSTNEDAVNKHLNSLQTVMKDDHLDLVRSADEMKDFAANVTRVLNKMRTVVTGIREELYQDGRISPKTIYKIFMSYFLRLQSQVYTTQFLARSESALLDCRRNLLSSTLVPETVLRSDLLDLTRNISRDGYEVAIPLKDISRFYSLPISSCITSPEKIVITVKIPIKQQNQEFELYEYIPSPMAWRGYTCSLLNDLVYVAVAGDVLKTIVGRQKDDCDVRTSGICKVPRQVLGSSLSSECAWRMLKGDSIDSLRAACHFSCYPSHGGVLLTPISDVSYVVTHPSPSLLLNCPNSSLSFPSDIPGAFEVDVPCQCSLADKDNEYIPIQFPCFNTLNLPLMNHVLPLSWTSLNNISIPVLNFAERPIVKNISEIIDENWNISSPNLFIHNHLSSDTFEPVELPNSWADLKEVCSIKYLIIMSWLGVVTCLLVYCIFKLYILHVKLGVTSSVIQEVSPIVPPALPPKGIRPVA